MLARTHYMVYYISCDKTNQRHIQLYIAYNKAEMIRDHVWSQSTYIILGGNTYLVSKPDDFY